jgi:deazaflavin-dependent oxidoreductase (nitroreductase family)
MTAREPGAESGPPTADSEGSVYSLSDDIDYSLIGDEHVRVYRETDGATGYEWNGAPTLLLTTTGRRTGTPRTSALIFARDGDDYLVVASVGGMPTHPAWYLNLEANPQATIQVKADLVDVRARTASPDEKPRLWKIVTDGWPRYDAYQSRTDRVIPVVVLTPTS